MQKEVQMTDNYKEESYCFESDSVKLYITELSGRMTADFNLNGKTVNPYYVAPWGNENGDDGESAMRGSWFCFPFGLNEPYQGIEYPVHGFPLTSHFEKTDFVCSEDRQTLRLNTFLKEDGAQLDKEYTLINGENCIYMSDKITGAKGKYPVGYHPTLRIPHKKGSAIVDLSTPLESWTAPVHIEDPALGGYSCLSLGHKIEDMQNVPTIYGTAVDLTRHPFAKGFDDIYMHVCDASKKLCFTAVSVPEEGYLYFHLKNPSNLGNSMVWTSYTGRYYAPWNGRVNGCIGLEEINGYFCYGITAAQKDNPLLQKGYHMYDEFDGSTREYRMIQGVAAIGADYQGVKDIVKLDENHISIIGKDGSEITVACQTAFLEEL